MFRSIKLFYRYVFDYSICLKKSYVMCEMVSRRPVIARSLKKLICQATPSHDSQEIKEKLDYDYRGFDV